MDQKHLDKLTELLAEMNQAKDLGMDGDKEVGHSWADGVLLRTVEALARPGTHEYALVYQIITAYRSTPKWYA